MRFLEGTKAWKKMKNSVSDQGFYIESDEEDMEKELNKEENDGNDSDDSNDWNDNHALRKPSSYSILWPQSYRSAASVLFQFLCSLWIPWLWHEWVCVLMVLLAYSVVLPFSNVKKILYFLEMC